jgi:hypothetical protein
MMSVENIEQQGIASGKITTNHLHDMIALAQNTSSKVLYCANVLTGTPAQAVQVLQAFSDAGVPVVGVEFGNEMYLRAYKGVFTDVDAYIARALQFKNAIEAQFPNIPLGLSVSPPAILRNVGPYVAERIHLWNTHIASATWADAITLHCYPRIDDICTQTDPNANMPCALTYAGDYATTRLDSAMRYLEQVDGRTIWVSEWNVDGAWSHYGNTLFQSLFCADMMATLSKYPDVAISILHNLLSFDMGFNVVQRSQGPVYSALSNFHTLKALQPLIRNGNIIQPHNYSGVADVHVLAFKNTATNKQNLLVVNRSGTAFDLSELQVGPVAGKAWVVGGTDPAEGTGPNDFRPNGNLALQTINAADIHTVNVPAYSVVMLEWTPTTNPAALFRSAFAGTENCTLVPTSGLPITQSQAGKCGVISNGILTCSGTTTYPCNLTVSRVVLRGATFQNIQSGRWVNERIRFNGNNGQLWDPVTQQVLATVQAGVRYDQLIFQFNQPVHLSSILGYPAGASGTAPMTLECVKVLE